jgi:thiol-disulfide isomerase/thioredoxin
MKETSSKSNSDKSKSVKSKSVKSKSVKSKSNKTKKINSRLKELKRLEQEFNTIFKRNPESKKEPENKLVEKKPTVIVLIHATWCDHCKSLLPEWAKMKNELASYITENNIVFKEIEHADINEQLPQLSQEYMNNKTINYKGFPTIGSIQEGVFEPYTNPRDQENLSIWVKSLTKMSGGTITMPNTPKASKNKNSPSSIKKKRTMLIDKTIKPKALFTGNINSINKAFDDMYKPDEKHNTSNRINPKNRLYDLNEISPFKPSIMGHGLPDLNNIMDSPKTRIDRRRLANDTYDAKLQKKQSIRDAGKYLETEPKHLGTMKVKTPTPKKGTPKTPNSAKSTPGGIFFN